MKVYPSLKLAQLPTPIHYLKRWSQRQGGPNIWIKRDDLTGIGFTGNKIRKLEFVCADALKKGADTLITCGGAQSNHARTTAVVAARLGLKSHLFLRSAQKNSPRANMLLDRLAGATIHAVTPQEYANSIDDVMADLADYLREDGHHPYIIPEGASNSLGALGYMQAFEEILNQFHSLRIPIDTIVCATGSGGTHAGLLLGKFHTGWDGEILSINVCDDEGFFVKKILGILKEASRLLDEDFKPSADHIHIVDGYVGEGYGIVSNEVLQIISDFASTEGIFLEPVYTGKAMLGLVDQISQKRFSKEQNVLFVHTGGVFELFAYEKEFSEFLS